MNNTTNTQPEDTKINVGVNIPADELDEMKRMLCVDLSGPAVLAMARKGVAAEKEKAAKLAEKSAN